MPKSRRRVDDIVSLPATVAAFAVPEAPLTARSPAARASPSDDDGGDDCGLDHTPLMAVSRSELPRPSLPPQSAGALTFDAADDNSDSDTSSSSSSSGRAMRRERDRLLSEALSPDANREEELEVALQVERDRAAAELQAQHDMYDAWLSSLRSSYEDRLRAMESENAAREQLLVATQRAEVAALGDAISLRDRALVLTEWHAFYEQSLRRVTSSFALWRDVARARAIQKLEAELRVARKTLVVVELAASTPAKGAAKKREYTMRGAVFGLLRLAVFVAVTFALVAWIVTVARLRRGAKLLCRIVTAWSQRLRRFVLSPFTVCVR